MFACDSSNWIAWCFSTWIAGFNQTEDAVGRWRAKCSNLGWLVGSPKFDTFLDAAIAFHFSRARLYRVGPDAHTAGRATDAPTQSAASLTRDGLGVGTLAPDAEAIASSGPCERGFRAESCVLYLRTGLRTQSSRRARCPCHRIGQPARSQPATSSGPAWARFVNCLHFLAVRASQAVTLPLETVAGRRAQSGASDKTQRDLPPSEFWWESTSC